MHGHTHTGMHRRTTHTHEPAHTRKHGHVHAHSCTQPSHPGHTPYERDNTHNYVHTYVYTHHTLTHRNVRICAQLARTCKRLIHRHTHACMRSNKHAHTYSPLFNLSSPPLILLFTQNNSSFLWSLHLVVISSPI